jgi:transcriptional regulator with XRE-family HTH domain
MTDGTAAPETIGALLAQVRVEQGVSQLRLAARLCAASGTATVTRHEISRWEREERIPGGYWLGWLAIALDLPVERLERAVGATRGRRGLATWDRYARLQGWRREFPGVYSRPERPLRRAS